MNSQVLVERLNKVCSEYVRELVMECGKLYSFEGSEALSRLGLLSDVQVLEKVEKVVENSLVPPGLLEKVEQKVEKKGRPKKSKKVLEVQGEDLFAELIAAAQKEVEIPVLENVLAPLPVLEKSKVAEQKKVEVVKKVVVSKEEKLSLKAAKEAEKLSLKAAKEAEKEALKAAKEAEKLSKKGDKKSVKKEKKTTKKVEEKKVEVSEEADEKSEEVSREEVSEEADVVKKFEYEGVKYLKSKNTGIIYNMEQEVVGKWNEESKKIEFEEEDDSSDEEE
jgi:hypothetical protein